MNTIGFWGQIDLEQAKNTVLGNVSLLVPRRKEIYLALQYVKEKLQEFEITIDWESAYEDGSVEFMIDYKEEVDIETVKENIKNFTGLVTFISFD